jgi:hypothetical protein
MNDSTTPLNSQDQTQEASADEPKQQHAQASEACQGEGQSPGGLANGTAEVRNHASVAWLAAPQHQHTKSDFEFQEPVAALARLPKPLESGLGS